MTISLHMQRFNSTDILESFLQNDVAHGLHKGTAIANGLLSHLLYGASKKMTCRGVFFIAEATTPVGFTEGSAISNATRSVRTSIQARLRCFEMPHSKLRKILLKEYLPTQCRTPQDGHCVKALARQEVLEIIHKVHRLFRTWFPTH